MLWGPTNICAGSDPSSIVSLTILVIEQENLLKNCTYGIKQGESQAVCRAGLELSDPD